ncbi:MAG: TIGR03084 family metal-binding protein [Rhodobacteraceae bacterium]|nr:TIGR03084 family metal-binding protein [Paracoccaceae bacterium]
MQQAHDFAEECRAVEDLIAPLEPADFLRRTQFKDWTVNHVFQHLAVFDRLALLSVRDPETFKMEWARIERLWSDGRTLCEATEVVLEGLGGAELRRVWADGARDLADEFARTDPRLRVAWVGPGMSARSSITARLMETWAHAQAVYDMLGQRRVNGARIRNIVQLGVNTYDWTFRNRGTEAPGPMPGLRLTAPDGTLWCYGEPRDDALIEGLAEEFCMVVAQTRNIADTGLRMTGAAARQWMAQAQCFAGPPHDPPAPGTRGIARPPV